MSAMTTDQSALSRGDLRKYPREVADVLLEAVNTYGVPYRLIDGNHIRLYCGDREVIPFKASASREGKYTLPYLTSWLDEHWPAWAEREKEQQQQQETEESLVALQAHFGGGAEETEEKPEQQEPEPEWVEYRNSRGKSYGFETDGSRYRCRECGHSMGTSRGLHLHAVMHSDKHEEHVRKSAEAKRAKSEERRLREQQEREDARIFESLQMLAEHHGYSLLPKGESVPSEEVESLREQVETLTREKGEIETRLALVREAFSA